MKRRSLLTLVTAACLFITLNFTLNGCGKKTLPVPPPEKMTGGIVTGQQTAELEGLAAGR